MRRKNISVDIWLINIAYTIAICFFSIHTDEHCLFYRDVWISARVLNTWGFSKYKNQKLKCDNTLPLEWPRRPFHKYWHIMDLKKLWRRVVLRKKQFSNGLKNLKQLIINASRCCWKHIDLYFDLKCNKNNKHKSNLLLLESLKN